MYEDNKYKARDRTTEEDHDWLKENYKRSGFKSAAAFLEHIIKQYKNSP
jgi:AraC-like DNA-binding protein